MSNAPSDNEVLDRQQPRRSFTVAEKLAIVAETRQPGVRFARDATFAFQKVHSIGGLVDSLGPRRHLSSQNHNYGWR
jgi:hypothetical protein